MLFAKIRCDYRDNHYSLKNSGALVPHSVRGSMAHPGDQEAYSGAVEAHPGAAEAHPGAVHAHLAAMEAHIELYTPWSLFQHTVEPWCRRGSTRRHGG
jgi:hypothetical protein